MYGPWPDELVLGCIAYRRKEFPVPASLFCGSTDFFERRSPREPTDEGNVDVLKYKELWMNWWSHLPISLIVFLGARVVVFCDGDFWHGRNWPRLFTQLQKRANAGYWCEKIRTDRIRDRRTTRLLEEQNWNVIRLWESEIKADPERIARGVESAVLGRQSS